MLDLASAPFPIIFSGRFTGSPDSGNPAGGADMLLQRAEMTTDASIALDWLVLGSSLFLLLPLLLLLLVAGNFSDSSGAQPTATAVVFYSSTSLIGANQSIGPAQQTASLSQISIGAGPSAAQDTNG